MSAISLPLSIIGKRELIKVQRELERMSEQLIQKKVVNESTGQQRALPRLSDITNEFLYQNKLELEPNNIRDLIAQLQNIRDSAPMLRVSFASEPDVQSVSKIVGWFRREVNPTILMQVGIQPSIAGGCIVQTPGHRYDFSLRKHIMTSQDTFRAVLARDVFGREPEAAATETTQSNQPTKVVVTDPDAQAQAEAEQAIKQSAREAL